MAEPADTVQTMDQFDPGISEAFASLESMDYPSVQEDRFIREYLPLFVARGNNPVNLIPWLEVAGHPHLAVNVFRGNKFLFRVPPMMRDVSMIPGDRSKGHSLYEEIMTAEQKRSILPRLGDLHLQDAIISRVQHEMASLEYIQAWNSIFRAYGHPEVELPVEAAAVIAEEETSSAPDEVVDTDVNNEFDGFSEM